MNNIILIGFMGSGKTTFGNWISQQNNMSFIDTDELIEEQQKRSINDIFATDGEAAFRDMETEAISQLCESHNNCVIAVGGGLPVREENRKILKKLGTVVYLQASEDELARRLTGDTKRPLLAGTDIRRKIHDLMKQRESLYLDGADLIISTENKSFEAMYQEIVDGHE